MSETLLSSRNLAFELYEVLDAEALTQRERFAEHNRETFDAALDTAERIATLDLVSDGRVDFGTGEASSEAELGGFLVDRATSDAFRDRVQARLGPSASVRQFMVGIVVPIRFSRLQYSVLPSF